MPSLWRPGSAALILGLDLLAGGCSSGVGSFGYWPDRPPNPVRHDLSAGKAALAHGDLQTAGPLLEGAAASGHPAALMAYARYLDKAPGGDPAQARALLEEAYAKRSSRRADAAVALATLLIAGEPSDADLARAVELLEYARDAGHRWTARKLAITLEQQPEHDPERIDALWREAAQSGDPSAKLHLAEQRLHEHGRDAAVAALVDGAIAILSEKAEVGNVGAMRVLARLYMADQLIAADREQAAHWLELAVAENNAAAMSDYGRLLYLEGDVAGARRWYEQAAAQGARSAESRLARLALQGRLPDLAPAEVGALAEHAIAHDPTLVGLYGQALLKGELVPADPARGRAMLERAAADDNARALYALAMMDLAGGDQPADPVRDLERLEKAVAVGSLTAQVHLGKRLLFGLDVPADAPRGLALLQDAAERGHSYAEVTLGRAYMSGRGVPKNLDLAREHLDRAATAGEAEAQQLLIQI